MSFGQQVGSSGEKFFAYWASQHRLLATKAEDDIGIDYLCQVSTPVQGSTSLEAQGSMLGAQVKSVVSGASARVVLERIDAVDLLNQTQATCLFGVQLDAEIVRFRFIDTGFVDQLLTFVAGNNESWSFPFADLSEDAEDFYIALAQIANPFFQQRLRIHQAQRRLERAIPGAAFSVRTCGAGTSSYVHVPRVHDAYLIDEAAAGNARIQILERGYADPTQQGIGFLPEIQQIVNETQSTALVLTGAAGEIVDVKIRSNGDEATASFDVREYRDEVSLVHRAGFRLTVSAARKNSDHYVHELEHDLFVPDQRYDWDDETFAFFELFRPGAELVLPGGRVWPLTMFGESVQHLGAAIKACRGVSEALQKLLDFALADLNDEEFSHSLNFLNAFLLEGITVEQLVQGFVLGPGAELPTTSLSTRRFEIRLPVGLNWKSSGVVAWITGQAEGFIHEGKLCGFRMARQSGWSIETHPRFDKSLYPEAWFFADWPPIPIGSLQVGVSSFDYSGCETPLEAELEPFDDKSV